jgi:hypothetical protein
VFGLRSLVLTFGPLALIGASYVTAAPGGFDWQDFWDRLGKRPTGRPLRLSETPPETYDRSSARLQSRLPSDWAVIDEYPFLLTGNVSERHMQVALDDVIRPMSRALAVDYFDYPPSEPITLVLMADDASYSDALGRLGHRGREEYAGIYSKRDRRLILNLATGDGTLAHELTHALAHADFPRLPEWLDEGLAALHEESVFSDDGHRLIGLANWRDAALRAAYRRQRPPEIEQLVLSDFDHDDAEVDYAFARNICLYLQSRELLSALYRKSRARIADDPHALKSLLEITGSDSTTTFDDTFREWFLAKSPRP